jgi:hypothetical protein
MLYGTLQRLVELGVLETRDEPDLQYRWCSTYSVANESEVAPVVRTESPLG